MHYLRGALRSRGALLHRRIVPFRLPCLKKQPLPRTIISSTAPAEPSASRESSSKSWRENPNLKYWVIGVLGITGSIYYYFYKDRDKKRLRVKMLPPNSAYYTHPRNSDIEGLENLHSHLRSQSPLVILQIVGPTGYGKTILAGAFAEKLTKQEEEKYEFIPGNHLLGTVNASSLDSMMFDTKRLAIALGCVAEDWISRASQGTVFGSLNKEEQLNCLVGAVKDKLVVSPGWVLILDNMKNEEIMTRCFLTEASADTWGRGTVLITKEGVSRQESMLDNVYSLEKGMSQDDAVETLCTLSGLSQDKRFGAEEAVTRLERVPLAIACAGHYIRSKATQDPDYSFLHYLTELTSTLDGITGVNGVTGMKGNATYAAIAMETKNLLEDNPHFLHTFDLISTCSPDWPIPISLISLHLRSPDFNLSPVIGSGPALPSQSQDEPKPKEEAEGEEVAEMFLSIKRLAKNLENFTTAVKANVEAVKAMLHPEPMDIPTPVDGVLELMRSCPLVSVVKVDPGGVETIVVSPIIQSVFQQLFLSKTAPQLEEKYLAQAKEKHSRSSWFRRLWSFDPQRTLQEYRNSLGEGEEREEVHVHSEAQEKWILSYPEVNIKGLFHNPQSWVETESYRVIRPRDAVRHCQQHTSRTLKTINSLASVCGQDTSTQSLARLIKPHLDHILATNTQQNLGPKTRVHALSAVASIDASAGNLISSRDLLEDILPIETQLFGELSLDVASTLTRLADVYSSLDDATKSRELLERALQIYEKQRQKAGEYKKPLEFAHTMSALGGVYGSLGFKDRSMQYIERAFSFMQSAAPTNPDEIQRRQFAGDVSSTLTDLGHAYLSAGNTTQARKILDLALQGHKNLYGDEHPEVVRTLTVLGIAYTMQGNWPEGKKMRKEAGKVQARLDARPQM